jgi:hypothetical protein
MENEIIQKLHGVLSVAIEKESEVVYLFIEIRKFLDRVFGGDRDKEKHSFPVLRMFCDWVAHTELTKYGKGSVLESLDNAFAAEEQSNKPLKEAFDIFSLETLRKELKNFLRNNCLPTNIADDSEQWGRLLQLYVNAVSESPLKFVDKKNCQFKQMKSATLVFHQIPDTVGQLTVAWQWKLQLKNDTTRTLSHSYGCLIGNQSEIVPKEREGPKTDALQIK